MKTTHFISTILVASGLLLSGCGEIDSANARSGAPKVVSKWKHQPKSAVGGVKGIIIESQADEVTAISVHYLKDAPGFVVDSTLSANKFVTKDGVLIIPLSLPPFVTVEDWLAQNGSCWEVTWKPDSEKVMAKFRSPGVPDDPMEFVAFRE